MSVAEKFLSMEYGPAPEDPREALVWLDQHERKLATSSAARFGRLLRAFISTRSTFDGRTPGGGCARFGGGHRCGGESGARALAEWQSLTPHARARYLYALARQVQKHSRRLAVLETMDNGKPIRESRDLDIPLVARHFYHHAGWAQLLPQEFPGYVACGVVGQIIPWNFPLLMLAWKIAPHWPPGTRSCSSRRSLRR